MAAGQVWPAECSTYEDPTSGVTVRRLTDHKGHSHHLYFTNPGWWDGARRMLFGSDRMNRSNLFSVEIESGEITQLTDLEKNTGFLAACVNPTRVDYQLVTTDTPFELMLAAYLARRERTG